MNISKKIILEKMQTKKFMVGTIVLLMFSGVVLAGVILFHAGTINGSVTIGGSMPQTYDVEIDNTQCPCTITDTLTMTSNESVMVQHNIKNNENFPIDATISVTHNDTGLNVSILDGTLNPTTTITINGLDNKWFYCNYETDDVSEGSILSSTIEIHVQPT